MSRKQAIDYMQNNGDLKYIYTKMIECKNNGQEGCLGYFFFQQLDRKDYANTLKKITTNSEIKYLMETKKGMLA
eukprot:1563488-Heterocapsa_arctica.AAC.1